MSGAFNWYLKRCTSHKWHHSNTILCAEWKFDSRGPSYKPHNHVWHDMRKHVRRTARKHESLISHGTHPTGRTCTHRNRPRTLSSFLAPPFRGSALITANKSALESSQDPIRARATPRRNSAWVIKVHMHYDAAQDTATNFQQPRDDQH